MTRSDVAVYRRLVPLLRPYRCPLVGALVLAACGPRFVFTVGSARTPRLRSVTRPGAEAGP